MKDAIWRIFLNPILLLLLVAIATTLGLMIVVTAQWVTGQNPAWTWAIAGSVWISMFSAGVFGAAYHASRALMQDIPLNSDTSRLSVLTHKEYLMLKAWVNGQASVHDGKLVVHLPKEGTRHGK